MLYSEIITVQSINHLPIRRDENTTDMEKVLKNSLVNFKKTKETCKQFCCNTIVLSAETYVRTHRAKSDSLANSINKIYRVEVIIDGDTVFEHYGKNPEEMNKQYLLALDMCQG